MNTPFDIVLMVGIPGSGKTTFYRERLFPSHIYISLDQLRTRSAEAELFAFALKRHKPCVIDNTNVTAAERRRYITLAQKEMDARIVVYCFVPDLEGCLARNGQRRGRARVPEVAIKCKLAKFEPPDFGEGIDEIYDVKVSENGFEVRRRNENGRETRLLRLSPRGGRRRSPGPRHADEVPRRPGHPGLHVARLRRVVVSVSEVLRNLPVVPASRQDGGSRYDRDMCGCPHLTPVRD